MLIHVPCPRCQQAGIQRLAALRPPVRCAKCGVTAVRAQHPVGDALELLAPPFIVVSLLLSFFHWSLLPFLIVAGLWLAASAQIPLVPAEDGSGVALGKDADEAENAAEAPHEPPV